MIKVGNGWLAMAVKPAGNRMRWYPGLIVNTHQNGLVFLVKGNPSHPWREPWLHPSLAKEPANANRPPGAHAHSRSQRQADNQRARGTCDHPQWVKQSTPVCQQVAEAKTWSAAVWIALPET